MYIHGEIVLDHADEGQKPEIAVQGLHLLSFGTALVLVHSLSSPPLNMPPLIPPIQVVGVLR